MQRLEPAMGSELRQIPPCRAAGQDSLSHWQGDSVGLMGLALAPHWRTQQVSVRTIPRGWFSLRHFLLHGVALSSVTK